MTAVAAWRDGMRRVNTAPAVLAGVWLATVVFALPMTLALRDMLAQHLGGSLAADSAASGVNYDWMQEFADQASGVGVTFKPTIIGFGAVLDNVSAFLDATARPVVITAAAAAYIALWIFLAGGIVDRYARDRSTGLHGFFAASGVFFVRFLRLAVLQSLVYAVLFGLLHPYLFGDLFPALTRETTVERNAFMLRLALYAVFAIPLAAANLVFDYAKIRAVVEDRRSMIGAISGALRFVRMNGAAAGAYLLNVLLFVACVGAYALVAPGARGAGISTWIALAIGQLYVAARLWIKVAFWASGTALFQSRLAHAGYVRRAPEVWPDSPSAEAITP
jgi:hypothetical protein